MASTILSVRVPKSYDEHQRNQFLAFHYDASIHEPERFESQEAFIQFLNTQHLESPGPGFKFTFPDFIDVANAMAKSIKATRMHSLSPFKFDLSTWIYTDFAEEPLLVFQDTGKKAPPGHVTDSQCNPSITAAFDIQWHIVAMRPACRRKSVCKEIRGRSEETGSRLPPLPPPCPT
jgi:hypothetical protein